MNYSKSILMSISLLLSSWAVADLEPWSDYEVSDEVWSITTVKVHANMSDAYLEGIRDTWVQGQKTAMELGHIESFHIFRSDMEASGDFNMILAVRFANDSMLTPNKERYEAMMDALGADESQAATEQAQRDYPAMRDIVGEYRMREITLK